MWARVSRSVLLDVFHVLGPDDTPDYNTVEPVTAEEARELLASRSSWYGTQ
ncbi:hypothetical protein [Streptomyces sp. NPDC093568]|uniref:hypothetical protein n=1 Tax=Streptomyces sp. NPDC093568 TaxID=3366041 RepID=UPI00382ECA62